MGAAAGLFSDSTQNNNESIPTNTGGGYVYQSVVESDQILQAEVKTVRINRRITVDGDSAYDSDPESALDDFIQRNVGIRFLRLSSEGRKIFIEYIKKKHPIDYQNIKANYNRTSVRLLKAIFGSYLKSIEHHAWCAEKLQLKTPWTPSNLNDLLDLISHLRSVSDVTRVSQVLYFTTFTLLPDFVEAQRHHWFLLRVGSIVESIPLVVYLLVPDATRGFPVVYANKETEKITGYAREELLGKNNPFLANSAYVSEKSDELKQAILNCEPRVTQLLVPYKDGSIADLELRCKPLCDKWGKNRFVLVVQTETTAEYLFDIVSAVFAAVPLTVHQDSI